jgi:uncharacterized protein YdeI (YjbR/CyaY-like superfamily)
MAKASNTELDLPMRSFRDQKTWEKWLATNHSKSPGIWMQIAKKYRGIASVYYRLAVDVAL